MKYPALLLLMITLAAAGAVAQTTDLSGLTICIDPGHGGHSSDDRHVIPDPGIDFWESESNFQKALHLRALLEAYGATVILTRTSNDTVYSTGDDEPSLAARVEIANSNNVDWFHSIHSNALGGNNTTTNYTLMLVREKRPGGPASSTGNGLGVPEDTASWTMANLMGPSIRSINRTSSTSTWLDWTFYGGVNGGYSLGVLRGLLMPGELSEGSFHDFYPETRRLMNNDYRKMEAYALRNAFLQYFGVPPDQHAIIAGIQQDISTGRPINGTRVRLLPEERITSGDSMNNGYYLFDSLAAGMHTVVFETPGFTPDTQTVTLAPGEIRFIDRTLERSGPPYLAAVFPVPGDTAVTPGAVVTLTFSRPMDTASVNHAFSIDPAVPGTISWSSSNSVFSFHPVPPLATLTTYAVRIEPTAHAASGGGLDGNGDGTAGDPFSMTFKTNTADVIPPALVLLSPDSNSAATSPLDVINLVFDERLTASTVNISNVKIQQVGRGLVARTVQYWEANGRGAINAYLTNGFVPGASYAIMLSGVADALGNAIPSTTPLLWSFSIPPFTVESVSTLDSLNLGSPSWPSPMSVPGTSGVTTASFVPSTFPGIVPLNAGRGSMVLPVTWTSVQPENLLYAAAPAADRPSAWGKGGNRLQCYVRGDGRGTRFRFVVRDSVASGLSDDEVSTWTRVTWIGWRLVQWDLEHDSVGTWQGNGTLDGSLTFEGFQLAPSETDTTLASTLGFNGLSVVSGHTTSVSSPTGTLPRAFVLDQNYPNPFNPTTVVSCQWPVASVVRIGVYDVLGQQVALLANGWYPAGKYAFRFDGSRLASGVYFYRLNAGSFSAVRKMTLVK